MAVKEIIHELREKHIPIIYMSVSREGKQPKHIYEFMKYTCDHGRAALFYCPEEKLDAQPDETNIFRIDSSEKQLLMEEADICCTADELEDFIWQIQGKNHFKIMRHQPETVKVESFLDDGDYFWVTAGGKYSNALIRVSKIDYNIEMHMVPFAQTQEYEQYGYLLKAESKIYMIPKSEDNLISYNVELNQWEKLAVFRYESRQKFSEAFLFGKNIYLMPRDTLTVYKYNLQEKKIYELNMGNYLPLEMQKKSYKASFCLWGGLHGKDYWFYSRKFNTIMKFDLEKEKLSIEYQFDSQKPAEAFNEKEGVFALFFHEDICKVTTYNIFSREMKNYQCNINFDSGIGAFGYLEWLPKGMYFLPGQAQNTYYFNLRTGEFQKAEGFDLETRTVEHAGRWRYSFSNLVEEKIYAYDMIANKLICYDTNTCKTESIPLSVTESAWYQGMAEKMLNILELIKQR